MSETTAGYGPRLDRVEENVRGLGVEMGKVTTCVSSLGDDNKAIIGKLDKIEASRPGVSSILPWFMAAIAAVGMIGGALVVPQLARVDRIEEAARQRVPVAREQTAELAILCHDAIRRGDFGCQH